MTTAWKILLLVALTMTWSSVTCATIDDLSLVLSAEAQASLEAKLNDLFEEMHTENWRLRLKQIEQETELRRLRNKLARANEQMRRLTTRMSTPPTDRV